MRDPDIVFNTAAAPHNPAVTQIISFFDAVETGAMSKDAAVSACRDVKADGLDTFIDAMQSAAGESRSRPNIFVFKRLDAIAQLDPSQRAGAQAYQIKTLAQYMVDGHVDAGEFVRRAMYCTTPMCVDDFPRCLDPLIHAIDKSYRVQTIDERAAMALMETVRVFADDITLFGDNARNIMLGWTPRRENVRKKRMPRM